LEQSILTQRFILKLQIFKEAKMNQQADLMKRKHSSFAQQMYLHVLSKIYGMKNSASR